MPLLLFLQFGRIGEREYTIGEVARQMYRSGYDFRHFLATSVPVIIAEAIVRLTYFARVLHQGGSLSEALPGASHSRLRGQLCLAHLIATGMNAGRIMITRNPLTLNWAQWLALFRYLVPQAIWLLYSRQRARDRHIQRALLEHWQEVDADMSGLWQETFGCHGRPAIL